MRKLCITAALLAAFAVSLAAQEVPGTSASTMSDIAILNTNTYASCFGFKNGQVDIDSHYIWDADIDDIERFGGLAGDIMPDTPLEFALLSYYSQPVINIRPIEAKNMLPANNPRAAGLKLGSAVLKELAELKFLDPSNTAAIGRYEGMIKYISDKNGVSRADIEKYLKDGIAAVVDEEFNKTRFLLDRNYYVTLTRNQQNGQYELSYEDANYVTKKLTTTSLESLSSAMSRSGDFSATAFNQVRAEAANIPAVFLTKTGKDPRAELAAILTTFYLNPTNQTVYGTVRDVNVYYDVAAGVSDNPANREMYEMIGAAYINTLTALSPELKQRVINDSRGRTSITLSVEVRNRLQLTSLQQ